MKDRKRHGDEEKRAQSLKAEAEKRLSGASEAKPEKQGRTHEEIVHELSVHQIELEMQNEALRKTQLDLEESRDRYADLYDFAPVGYFTFNHRGVIKDVNLTGASLLGVERKKLLNRGFGRFVSQENLAKWDRHLMDTWNNTGKQNCELLLERSDGFRFHAGIESVRVDSGGGTPAVRSIMSDITERKQAEETMIGTEETIRLLNNQLKHRIDELDAAYEQLEAFSYSVSHDLRAPLRHISGFVKLLQQRMGSLGGDTPDIKAGDYMDTIFRASEKMGMLIDDLLNFSRLGIEQMKKRKVNLNALVSKVVREIGDELKSRKIRWEIDELPEVYGDPALLNMVFANLLSNAVKYTCTLHEAEIRIGSKDDGDETIFFVQDNGVGFDMKYVGRLFGVFQRLHSENEFKGTGIGLANVRRIISRHGGRTWAEGSMGKGATFYFTLPKKEEPVKCPIP